MLSYEFWRAFAQAAEQEKHATEAEAERLKARGHDVLAQVNLLLAARLGELAMARWAQAEAARQADCPAIPAGWDKVEA